MSGGVRTDPTFLHAEMRHLLTQVTPENVLQIHNGVQAEVAFLADQLKLNGYPARVGVAADEAVSTMAASAFTAKIQGLVQEAAAYIDELRRAAAVIRAQAIRYGHTEDEIRRSFEALQADTR